mmetsp:Transcript_6984/g.21190  ORF Transcript_6984/g.21190 Transcript_6984/m.21190 type:complete len:382 (+) Transcript_6984:389-1534(+)
MLVRPDNVQRLCCHHHGLAHKEVLHLKVLPCVRVCHPFPLRELAPDVAAVALLQLEDRDGDGVGLRVERNEQPPRHVLWLTVGHLRLKAQDLSRERHEANEVDLWRLRLDHLAVGEGVLWGTDAVVGRRVELRVPDGLLGDIELAVVLVDAHVVLVERPSEVVAIVQHDLPPPDIDGLADNKVLGQVWHSVWNEHGRHRWQVVLLVQRSTLQEDRVVVTPGILAVGLVDLHSVVRKVKVHNKVDPGAVGSGVVPEPLETENLAIVQQELLDLGAWWLANLILRQGLGIHSAAGRGQAALLSSLAEAVGLLPEILHKGLILPNVNAVLLVEPAGEAVATGDMVRPAIDDDVLATPEVVWANEACAVLSGHLVALEESTLRDA